MVEAGLILEGGGMKGVYSAGVLDFFLDKKIEFKNCYGVSAGACVLSSFLSRQRGRGYHVFTDYLNDKRYMSLYSLMTTGDLFNVHTAYELIPNYLYPVDNDAYHQYAGNFYAVVTNILTGKAEYHRIKDLKDDIASVRASASLPVVSRNVYINHMPYLDGGISDSLPIRRAQADGNQKNIVVLTKCEGYSKTPSKHTELYRIRYAKYPKVTQLMKKRHITYNETLQYIEEQQKKGTVFVIRPSKELKISRTEKDADKLKELYHLGYQDAKAQFEAMKKYLED